jgi:hypothetical protein
MMNHYDIIQKTVQRLVGRKQTQKKSDSHDKVNRMR